MKTTKSNEKDENYSVGLTISSAFLREVCGVSDSRIDQLASMGIVKRIARGRFDAWASVKGYIRFLHERQSSKSVVSDVHAEDFEKHRARLYAARADAAELVAARQKGTMHDAEAVAAVMNTMLASFRSRILALPTAMAPRVADLSDPNACLDVLTDAIYQALTEMSNYDASAVVARQNKQRMPDQELEDIADLTDTSE